MTILLPLVRAEIFGTRVDARSSARSVEIFAWSHRRRALSYRGVSLFLCLSRTATLVGERLVRSSVARSAEFYGVNYLTKVDGYWSACTRGARPCASRLPRYRLSLSLVAIACRYRLSLSLVAIACRYRLSLSLVAIARLSAARRRVRTAGGPANRYRSPFRRRKAYPVHGWFIRGVHGWPVSSGVTPLSSAAGHRPIPAFLSDRAIFLSPGTAVQLPAPGPP